MVKFIVGVTNILSRADCAVYKEKRACYLIYVFPNKMRLALRFTKLILSIEAAIGGTCGKYKPSLLKMSLLE